MAVRTFWLITIKGKKGTIKSNSNEFENENEKRRRKR